MTDHYEDAEDQKQRTLPNRKVIGFVMRYWLRRPGLLSGMVLFSLLSIAADMAIPLAAGRLVDAVAEGPQAANVAWGTWAVFVALYLALIGGSLSAPSWIYLLYCALGGFGQIIGTNLLIMSFGHRGFAVGTAYSKTEAVQAA